MNNNQKNLLFKILRNRFKKRAILKQHKKFLNKIQKKLHSTLMNRTLMIKIKRTQRLNRVIRT